MEFLCSVVKVFSTKINANDITSLYKLDKGDNKQSFKALMFKMAPRATDVKLKGGKRIIWSGTKRCRNTYR